MTRLRDHRPMSGAAGDPLAGLSLKERELLQYLEDLQRNNPSEYDMIAKQIQEGGTNLGEVLGDSSKAEPKKPPAPKGEMVTPEPGFVAKTHSFTHQARKTFINLCKSDHVDPPAQVEVPGGKLRPLATPVLRTCRVRYAFSASVPHPHPHPHPHLHPHPHPRPSPLAGAPDECQMRIPLSLGPPREDLDKDGEVCCVYDVVFHSETLETALNDKQFRGFVLQLAAHQVSPSPQSPSPQPPVHGCLPSNRGPFTELEQIKEKHGDELSQDFKFPKLANNYKGLAPLPQLMRRKGLSEAEAGAKAKAKPASEGGGWDGGGSRKPMVEEVSEPEVPTTSLAAPTFVVEPTTWGGGAGAAAAEGGAEGDGGGDEQQPAIECLAVRVHLPLVDYCDELQLQLGVETLTLHAPGKYALSVSLPRAVAAEPLACSFETERCILRVVLAAAAAPSAADGLSDASLPDASEQVSAAPGHRRPSLQYAHPHGHPHHSTATQPPTLNPPAHSQPRPPSLRLSVSGVTRSAARARARASSAPPRRAATICQRLTRAAQPAANPPVAAPPARARPVRLAAPRARRRSPAARRRRPPSGRVTSRRLVARLTSRASCC